MLLVKVYATEKIRVALKEVLPGENGSWSNLFLLVLVPFKY